MEYIPILGLLLFSERVLWELALVMYVNFIDYFTVLYIAIRIHTARRKDKLSSNFAINSKNCVRWNRLNIASHTYLDRQYMFLFFSGKLTEGIQRYTER